MAPKKKVGKKRVGKKKKSLGGAGGLRGGNRSKPQNGGKKTSKKK